MFARRRPAIDGVALGDGDPVADGGSGVRAASPGARPEPPAGRDARRCDSRRAGAHGGSGCPAIGTAAARRGASAFRTPCSRTWRVTEAARRTFGLTVTG